MFSETLVNWAEKLSIVYIVVDGVNESAKASDIVTVLLSFARSSSHFRFLFSSTENSKSSSAWRYCRLIPTEMDASAVDPDIQVYVNDQLAKNPSLRRYTRSLKADIGEAILELADGKYVAVNSPVLHCEF